MSWNFPHCVSAVMMSKSKTLKLKRTSIWSARENCQEQQILHLIWALLFPLLLCCPLVIRPFPIVVGRIDASVPLSVSLCEFVCPCIHPSVLYHKTIGNAQQEQRWDRGQDIDQDKKTHGSNTEKWVKDLAETNNTKQTTLTTNKQSNHGKHNHRPKPKFNK